MNNKKLLKEIKEHLDFIQFEYDRQGYISTNTADELIEYSKYLIEKVEYWRDQHRKRVDELEEAYFKIQLLENKLERYKKALKKIADINLFEDIDRTMFLILTARKALGDES